MRFQDAMANTNDVREYYQAGLQALSERDRNRLSCENPRKISGSLHLDVAVAQLYPNAARWDYGIGIKKTEGKDEAIWLEIHPADSNQVPRMVDKVVWLKNWLINSAPNLMVITNNDSPYVWIASGRVSIPKNSPQAKRLALMGLKFPKEHYFIETR